MCENQPCSNGSAAEPLAPYTWPETPCYPQGGGEYGVSGQGMSLPLVAGAAGFIKALVLIKAKATLWSKVVLWAR